MVYFKTIGIRISCCQNPVQNDRQSGYYSPFIIKWLIYKTISYSLGTNYVTAIIPFILPSPFLLCTLHNCSKYRKQNEHCTIKKTKENGQLSWALGDHAYCLLELKIVTWITVVGIWSQKMLPQQLLHTQ